MELTLTHEPGYSLTCLHGVLDEAAEERFREYLHPLVRTRGTKLVVDLSGVPRVTSSGISQLVLLVTNAHTNNSRVVLLGATPFVAGVLSVTKLDRFFEQANSLSQALDLLSVTS
ncbi:MAG: STAS domain-containing protein [Pirellulaceae bacterium]